MTASAAPGAGPIAARFTDVSKQYTLDEVPVQALHGVDFTIERGGFTVLCGPSGSGKSTLLHLLGCLDTPTSGRIEVAGADVGQLSDIERSNFRARHIGFVFQSFNLIPVLTTLENVEYPLQLTMPDRKERRQRARHYLEAVGLGRKLDRRPSQLSGGERQRVAVARAMAKEPALVLADEPTANLDRKTGAELIALMRRMQHEHHVTFVFSSHDAQLFDDADVCLQVEDGKLVTPPARSFAHTELAR